MCFGKKRHVRKPHARKLTKRRAKLLASRLEILPAAVKEKILKQITAEPAGDSLHRKGC